MRNRNAATRPTPVARKGAIFIFRRIRYSLGMNLNTSIKAIIFDMDGVILDTEKICVKTWLTAGAEMGLPDIVGAYRRCIGTNLTDTKAILHALYGDAFDTASFLERTAELFCRIEREDGIPLMPYAREALEYLCGKYTVALASSTNRATVQRQLTNAGVIRFFATLTCGDDVTHAKPSPEIYQIACRSLSLPPENCAAIEDSPNGIKSAFAADLRPVMIPDLVEPTDEIRPLTWKICRSLGDIPSIF